MIPNQKHRPTCRCNIVFPLTYFTVGVVKSRLYVAGGVKWISVWSGRPVQVT